MRQKILYSRGRAYQLVPASVSIDNTQIEMLKLIFVWACQYFNINAVDLYLKSRKAEVIQARHVCMFLIKRQTTFNTVDIGAMFEQDHSTVIHALNKIDAYLVTFQDYATKPIEDFYSQFKTNTNGQQRQSANGLA